ncbi:hypothetical protein PR202_ga31204 [Eleusine coracana subsp. coracana]|uniref:Sulfite oxidase n=1 Tax=Eleusine coracana subsp. coracana TaxID=191504 RepID=A0AAV5DPK3_ELECO|nr:hypothetical protein PR202_ga31204 [Eleusine coracana subsp. coracana]
MALRGPSDYSEEPPRHPSLRINAKEPFNAEPTRRDLVASYITPVDFFFKRNHGPIPVLHVASYYVTIGGLVGQPRRLSLDDIRKLPKYNVTATLQCAGNRRAEMSKSRKVRGVGWDVCALGNATWGGAKLSDVLHLGFFMQKDYKMFPPSVDWDNIVWSTRKPQMDYPIQSAICSLEDTNAVKSGQVTVAGYALTGGGRGIERVDISTDGGKSWFGADRYQKEDVPYVAGDITSDKWAWVLFKAVVDVNVDTEIVAKAVDSSANVQPESVESIWNLRGILNTCWHRVRLLITPSFRSFL